jgi:hypothetical protein
MISSEGLRRTSGRRPSTQPKSKRLCTATLAAIAIHGHRR